MSFTSIQSFFTIFLLSSALAFPPFLSFLASSFFGWSFAPFFALGVYILGDDFDDLPLGLSSSSFFLGFFVFFGFSSSDWLSSDKSRPIFIGTAAARQDRFSFFEELGSFSEIYSVSV